MSYIESEKEEINENAKLICRRESNLCGVRAEASADYVLPDYMGDIKKVLKYSASVTPCNKYVSASEVSMLHIVSFRVMYLDSENILTEASFTADHENSEKFPFDILDADVETKIQNITVRLSGPRKINARANLVSDISYTMEDTVAERSVFPGTECQKNKIKIHSANYIKCAEREYAEEIDNIEDVMPDEIEVIKYDACAVIDSVHPTDSGANLSGYVDAFCVLRVGDDIMRLEKRIPIEEGIEIEDSSAESMYQARAAVSGVNLNINNGAGQKDDGTCFSSVVMNMSVECYLTHHFNKEYTVVTDAFYEGCKNSCSYETLNYNELCSLSNEKIKLSFTEPRGEELLHDIIDKEFTLKNVKFEESDSEINVTGDINLSLVARGALPEDCFSIKFDKAFSSKHKLSGMDNKRKIRLSAVPCEFSVAFDNEKIYMDCTLSVSIVTEEEKSEKILTDLKNERTHEECERCVYVYYPENDDTVWSVAKKYGISVEKLIRQNSANGIVIEENGAMPQRVMVVL